MKIRPIQEHSAHPAKTATVRSISAGLAPVFRCQRARRRQGNETTARLPPPDEQIVIAGGLPDLPKTFDSFSFSKAPEIKSGSTTFLPIRRSVEYTRISAVLAPVSARGRATPPRSRKCRKRSSATTKYSAHPAADGNCFTTPPGLALVLIYGRDQAGEWKRGMPAATG